MRTTIDLEPAVLNELKRRARREGRTLGQVASELLAPALREPHRGVVDFRWGAVSMGDVLVDLDDKESVQRILDEEELGHQA